MIEQDDREWLEAQLHSPDMKCRQCELVKKVLVPIPGEIASILWSAALMLKDSDSNRDFEDGVKLEKWLNDNYNLVEVL